MKTLMFHRFFDKKNKTTGQGSLTSEKLEEFIAKYGVDNFFNSKDINKIKNYESVSDKKILFTFDDGLNSQYQTAKPILDKYQIKSFWFIYTKIFDQRYDVNEILNYFVSRNFKNFNLFYKEFENVVKPNLKIFHSKHYQDYCDFLDSHFSFYSDADKKFRYIRNNLLSEKKFKEIVEKIIESYGKTFSDIGNKIWLNKEQIRELSQTGHEVGLHSHNHPYRMNEMGFEKQLLEYQTNLRILKDITGLRPVSVAYPLGLYNIDTLKVMFSLDIKLGFRSLSSNIIEFNKDKNHFLQIHRNDSANINL